MTFKIKAAFGNVQQLLISVPFRPHVRTDICVHATPASEHYANKFLELRSGRIAVERSAQVSVCFHVPHVGVWSQGRLWVRIEISQTGVWLCRRPVRAGPGRWSVREEEERGGESAAVSPATSGTNMSAYRKRVEGVGSKGRPVFPFKVLCSWLLLIDTLSPANYHVWKRN